MKKIEDLKTLENAIAYLGVENKNVIALKKLESANVVGHILAYGKLVVVIEAANNIDNDGEEWKLDFSNWDQIKYEIWWEFDKSSSGFRYIGCDDWLANSSVGSRLCFKSRSVAKYIAEQFEALYNEYL